LALNVYGLLSLLLCMLSIQHGSSTVPAKELKE